MGTTQVFQRGDTVPIWSLVKTWAGEFFNPTPGGVKITLKKPDGTIAKDAADKDIEDEPMSQTSIGHFVYHYDSRAKGDPPVDEPLGWWHYSCKAVDGTGGEEKTQIIHGGFKLV